MDKNGDEKKGYKLIFKILVLLNAVKMGWSINIIDDDKIELEKESETDINVSNLLDKLLEIK